ncbi:hypothetical protein C9J85_05065 [Haloferax sp. wsp5]|nr:hypothetical protein C9J85_05065 [Haloferax sp. wsp5]
MCREVREETGVRSRSTNWLPSPRSSNRRRPQGDVLHRDLSRDGGCDGARVGPRPRRRIDRDRHVAGLGRESCLDESLVRRLR